jgi:hypothetical protein
MDRKKRVVHKLNEFQEIGAEVEKDAIEVEKWVIERRRFFIKLGAVALFIIILLLIASIFLH